MSDLRATNTVRCRCGHNPARHEVPGFDGECIAEACRCTRYETAMPQPVPTRPAPPAPASRPTAPSAPARIDTVEQLVAAARETGDKRALLVIGRIQSMTAELSALIAAHRANTAAQAARERDEQFKAQLAAMPKVPGKRTVTRTQGSHPCPEDGCDYTATTPQGRAAHHRNVHQNLRLACGNPGCDRVFRTRATWTNHRSKCAGTELAS